MADTTKSGRHALAIRLARRCIEYVGGTRPTDPMMNCDLELYDLARAVLRAPEPPLQRAVEDNPGALAHAVRLLDWWADDGSSDEQIQELCKQSREVARTLHRFDKAFKKGERAWLASFPVRRSVRSVAAKPNSSSTAKSSRRRSAR